MKKGKKHHSVARCGFVSYCLPPFWDFPLFFRTNQMSKNNFFHRISYKKNGNATNSLVSWFLAVKGTLTKGLRTFLEKALPGLLISIWSIVFLQDQRSRLVSEGKKKEATGLITVNFFRHFSSHIYLVPLSSELRSNPMTYKTLF